MVARARKELKERRYEQEKRLNRTLTKEEQEAVYSFSKERTCSARRHVPKIAGQVVQQISQRLGQPLMLNATNFERHYETRLALPFPVPDESGLSEHRAL